MEKKRGKREAARIDSKKSAKPNGKIRIATGGKKVKRRRIILDS